MTIKSQKKPVTKKKKAVKRNPVAKHAGKFNRAAKHKDRKKAQKSGEIKHRRKSIES